LAGRRIFRTNDTVPAFVWKDGQTGGFASFIGVDVARHRGVVMLANVAGAEALDAVGIGLLRDKERLTGVRGIRFRRTACWIRTSANMNSPRRSTWWSRERSTRCMSRQRGRIA
jgi:hypothetical protein